MALLLLPDPDPDSPLMQEEIFGPLLPVLGFSTLEEALAFVQDRDTPLSCYIFTRSRQTARALLQRLSFGGGCVNDVLVHAGSHSLPFGGGGGRAVWAATTAGPDLICSAIPRASFTAAPCWILLCVIRLAVVARSSY
jgi:acyl-CoA reductase-like NAD-dependent aldehyde dehydrogenase